MLPETQNAEIHKVPVWPWRVGLVLKTPALIAEIGAALEEMSVECVFRILPSTPALEIAHTVQREKPELLLVELAEVSVRPSEWIAAIRSGEDIPLVVAAHPTADPDQMISALRSGASEFLSLPIRPGIFDALTARQLPLKRDGHRRWSGERWRVSCPPKEVVAPPA